MGLVAVLAVSCSAPERAAQVVEASPFVRLKGLLESGPRGSETKAEARNEYREVLFAPYKNEAKHLNADDALLVGVEATHVPVSTQDALTLADLLDLDELSPDATGVAVAYDVDPKRPPRFTEYIPFPKNVGEDALRTLSVPIHLPKPIEAEQVYLQVREVVPLPHEYRTGWVRVPAAARLDFGLAFEDPLQLPAPSPVRFSIALESESGHRTTIFDETLDPPAIGTPPGPWQDRSLDLASHAGEAVRFVLRTESTRKARNTDAPPDTTSPVWSDPVLYSAQATPADTRKPNIIAISIDTLRADHLGAYGYERDTSPNLDRIFKEGFLFEHCMSASSWTTPSHATFFTGLHPVDHRAGTHLGLRLRSEFTTLADLAHDAGYLTAAYTEGVAVGGSLGFYQGFDRYSDGPAKRPTLPKTAEATFGRAKRWLDRYGDLPFFMFVHTYEVHAPYAPPDDYLKKFSDGSVASVTPSFGPPKDDRERALWMNLYDGGIAYTDSVIGDFFAFLRAKGLLNNTIVILFSDHGEEFGDHGGSLHGLSLYNEQLHVPFFIRLPGASPAAGRIGEEISLADGFASVVELLGLDAEIPPSSHSVLPLMGLASRSGSTYGRTVVTSHVEQLAASWLIMSVQNPTEKYIVSTAWNYEQSPLYEAFHASAGGGQVEAPLEPTLFDFLHARDRELESGVDKARRDELALGAHEQYYDLFADPGEHSNLADKRPADLQRMRSVLEDRIGEYLKYGQEHGISYQPTAPLTQEELEKFKALGYVVQ